MASVRENADRVPAHAGGALAEALAERGAGMSARRWDAGARLWSGACERCRRSGEVHPDEHGVWICRACWIAAWPADDGPSPLFGHGELEHEGRA